MERTFFWVLVYIYVEIVTALQGENGIILFF